MKQTTRRETRRARLVLATCLHTALLPGAVLVAGPFAVLELLPEVWPLPVMLPVGLLAAVAALACGAAAWLGGDFVVRGDGTPNPLDPPRHLVTSGLYRHVRNPGYCAVGLLLAVEALYFRSTSLALYGVAVVGALHAFVVGVEERGLHRRFGRDYERYCAAVPRWRPRLRPWSAPGS